MPYYKILTQKGGVIIVTLKDIAKTCGVSVSTVSRAFDKNSRISQPVRQHILACAEELGYTPNLIARSLKNNRSMTIALIVPSIDNWFYFDVLYQLEIALHQYGYRLLVTFVHEGLTTERDCLETAVSAQADGLIIFSKSRENQQYIDSLLDRFKVIQLFSSTFAHIDSVDMDDEFGAELGTNYLIERGHRRIMYVGDEYRIAGFWRAIDAAHIPHEDVSVFPPTITEEKLCEAIQEFRPTAIFSIAYTSETVWLATRRLGLSVPKDISVIAFDDTKWISIVGLTVVAHDLQKITDTLVKQLLYRIRENSSTPPEHVVFNPFIIERDSVRKID